YVRDALFKHEILQKVQITTAEVEKAYEKNRYKLKVDYIKAENESDIQKIYNSLKKGVSFQSIRNNTGGLSDSCITISYGQLSELLEKILFKLKIGEYMAPVSAMGEWYIFRLIEKSDQLSAGKTRDQLLSEARKILHSRKTDAIYQEYYRKFFRSKKVETDGVLFRSLVDKLAGVIQKRIADPNIADKDKAYLSNSDIRSIQDQFGEDSLKTVFIHLESSPVTLKQFIDEVSYDGFVCGSPESKVVAFKLDNRVKSFIENELIAREGYKAGLQNLPEVKHSLKMWQDNYLSQILKNKLKDSLKTASGSTGNNGNLQEFGSNSIILVNIVEILTDSLENVEKILNELKDNKDIKQLAKIYSKRVSTKSTSGEFGYFPVTSYGEIGRIAATMEIGSVYGPLKTDEGYSIFKLIDRKTERQDNKGTEKNVQGNKPSYDPVTQKYLSTLTEYTAGLAKTYGVSINKELLNSTEAINLNLFAYRYMGFGGKIMAVPLTVPFTEWVEPWLNADTVVP
ncbi:MAG: peptidylprolyl isomerase, partial [Bacillota bacterium]